MNARVRADPGHPVHSAVERSACPAHFAAAITRSVAQRCHSRCTGDLRQRSGHEIAGSLPQSSAGPAARYRAAMGVPRAPLATPTERLAEWRSRRAGLVLAGARQERFTRPSIGCGGRSCRSRSSPTRATLLPGQLRPPSAYIVQTWGGKRPRAGPLGPTLSTHHSFLEAMFPQRARRDSNS